MSRAVAIGRNDDVLGATISTPTYDRGYRFRISTASADIFTVEFGQELRATMDGHLYESTEPIRAFRASYIQCASLRSMGGLFVLL